MSVNSDFYKFCRSGATGDVVKAIGQGVDVNARDENGNTALIFAASDRPRLEIIRALLEGGADAKARNADGATALMFASARTMRPDIITLLLNAGADANAELANGWTALMFAAADNPDPEVIKALWCGRAQMNHRAGDGTTALMLAAERNPNVDVVTELIKYGAHVNAKDDSGRTALIGAALRNSRIVSQPDPNPEIIDALLDGGADVNAVWDGDRAIDIVRDSPYLRGTDTLSRLGVLSAQGDGDRETMIERFIASLDVSLSTRAIYRKKLRYFFSWLTARGIRQPERGDILAWRDEMMSGNKRPVTVMNYLFVVRNFFHWAHKEGLCDDIGEGIESPKVERVFKDDTLTHEQVQEMLSNIDRSNISGLRDYALLSLIVSCGLSYAEVSKAKIGDIETENGEVFLNVSDGRVKVPESVMGALREYWNVRGEVKPESPVFNGGQTHKRQPMSARAIGLVMKGIARKIGLDKAVFTPNSLRHTAVRLALRSGKRIEDVKRLARHRYIGTTYRYGSAPAKRRLTCCDTITEAVF